MNELTLKECGTSDEAYKQLAVAIVSQAFSDYYDWLIKPDFDKEEAIFKEHLAEVKRLCSDIGSTAKYCQDDKEQRMYLDIWKSNLIRFMKKVRKSRKENLSITNKDGYFCTGYEKMIHECKDFDELFAMADKIRVRISALATYMKHKNDERKGEGERLYRFFHSERFYLYTGGRVDPDATMAEVERQAKRA